MKTIKMTRITKRRPGGADAPAVPTGPAAGYRQGWEGTREQGGNNLGNNLTPYISDTYIYLILYVPLFPLSNSLFKERRLLSKTHKETKSPFHISTSSVQEQGTREQTT